MSNKVKSYFEAHAHNYPKNQEFYIFIVDKIKRAISADSGIRLLDVGCGDGNFIKSLSKVGIKFEYFATDISFAMTRKASDNLSGNDVRFFVSDAFNMPIKEDFKFEIIHIDSVLHHLIGSTKGKSYILVRSILDQLVQKLTDNGILIVQEINFRSFLIPQLTSNIVFYGLKLNNLLKLDLSKIIPEAKPGLEVNFLDEGELVRMLSDYGSVDKIHQDSYDIPKAYKLFLLKNYGHSTYLMKR
jgi:SAM-dependent methyltransferase